MERHAGGCLCGAVRVVAEGPPLRVGICHCSDCRKHHGAMFYAAAIFAGDRVTVSGETRDFRGRHFCPVCGSSVFARSGEEVEVHLGTLDDAGDDAGDLVPGYECWTIRRADWLPPFAGMEGHLRDRDA
jgi:hypothetical protein